MLQRSGRQLPADAITLYQLAGDVIFEQTRWPTQKEVRPQLRGVGEDRRGTDRLEV